MRSFTASMRGEQWYALLLLRTYLINHEDMDHDTDIEILISLVEIKIRTRINVTTYLHLLGEVCYGLK